MALAVAPWFLQTRELRGSGRLLLPGHISGEDAWLVPLSTARLLLTRRFLLAAVPKRKGRFYIIDMELK